MDNLNVLGAIASIISLFITLVIIFWSVIKKTKISGFNLYMLVMVLINAILVGIWLWNGVIVIAMMLFTILMGILLYWLIQYLFQKQQDLIKSQMEIIKSNIKSIREMNQDMGGMNQQTQEIIQLFIEILGFIQKSIDISGETLRSIELKDEKLNEKIKKLQKKIDRKKRAK